MKKRAPRVYSQQIPEWEILLMKAFLCVFVLYNWSLYINLGYHNTYIIIGHLIQPSAQKSL